MSSMREPRFEKARSPQLRDELIARAKVWLPEWRRSPGTPDFAEALFEIAARIESEVAQRLDQVPVKLFRGFLDWLGVRSKAAQAARLPVVFNLANGAGAVNGTAPIQVQATPAQTDSAVAPEPVVFETEKSLLISPAHLTSLVGVDPAKDQFFVAGPDVFRNGPPPVSPASWMSRSAASAGAMQIQLEPATGLDSLPQIARDGKAEIYRVTKVEGGLVTIEPPLKSALGDQAEAFHLYSSFDPFGLANNGQAHMLYVGSDSLLNLPASADITVTGVSRAAEVTWSYWGKKGQGAEVTWQVLQVLDAKNSVLTKGAGSVEPREIDGKTSRWLRAAIDKVSESENDTESVQLAVNCRDTGEEQCPPANRSEIAVEGIANTVPLVLDRPFNPLGREPRLFDAFYLGSPEAFSKGGASVRICLEALDGTADSFAAATMGSTAGMILFGVGKDGSLRRVFKPEGKQFERLDPLRPPFGGDGVVTTNEQPALLNRSQGRINVLARDTNTLAAVAAGRDLWVWEQSTDPAKGSWHKLGAVVDQAGPGRSTEPVSACLMLSDGGKIHFVALCDGILHEGSVDSPAGSPTWRTVHPDRWTSIAPVHSREKLKGEPFENGWLAVSSAGKVALFRPDKNGNSTLDRWINIDPIDPRATPLAIREADDILMVVKSPESKITAWDIHYSNATRKKYGPVTADPLRNFDWTDSQKDKIAIVFTNAPRDRARKIAAWFPQTATGNAEPDVLYESQALGDLDGPPAVAGKQVAAPGRGAAALTLTFDPDALGPKNIRIDRLATAMVFDAKKPQPDPMDIVGTDFEGGAPSVVSRVKLEASGPDRFWQQIPGTAGREIKRVTIAIPLFERKKFNGTFQTIGPSWIQFTAPADDTFAKKEQQIEITRQGVATIHRITTVSGTLITVAPKIAGTSSGEVFSYRYLDLFTGKFDSDTTDASKFKADPQDGVAEKLLRIAIWASGDSDKVSVHQIKDVTTSGGDKFLTVDPKIPLALGLDDPLVYQYQAGHDFGQAVVPVFDVQDLNGGQMSALLGDGAFFQGGEPSPNRQFFVDPLSGAVRKVVFEEPWTTFPDVVAGNFQLTLNVVFSDLAAIADNLATNPELSWEYFDGQSWRHIAGLDDGTSNLRSTGIVKFCVPAGLKATEVAGRASHWIRARLVGGDYGKESVTIHTTKPDADGKTTQTAERNVIGITPPLLGSVNVRYSVCCLSNPDFVITADGGMLRDQTQANVIGGARVDLFQPLARTIANVAPGTDAKDGNALYLGFDAEISGGPLSVLFLVEEGKHDDAFPLRVEALLETGFETVASDDGTRGLNESGVLIFSLPSAPPTVRLFGTEARWVRLRPRDRFDVASWKPRIRAAYLNATFARASETQQLERLGSSDGSPKQKVTLARPPVIEGSLELRVREPLNDEEITALRMADSKNVLDVLENGDAGPWVLWTRVEDTDDAGKDARAYALDHETGEIRFGDGLHGRIPPIGTDAIVAMRYKRGGGLAANRVGAWSQLSLISPIQGVDKVSAPDGAAGGSDPQTPEEVLRFAPANQFLRDRALTLGDLEQLALQSTRDIAQARAIPSSGGIRLVAVTKGKDPRPNEAQCRELKRFLLEKSVPSLRAKDALVIERPRLVDLEVDLEITLDAIESSGVVTDEVKKRIQELLNPAKGNLDGTGWPLGELPTDADIAVQLDGVGHVEELRAIVRIGDAKIPKLRPSDLGTITPQAIRIKFEVGVPV